MADFQLTTPVSLLIFNRPDTTARVFEAIRHYKLLSQTLPFRLFKLIETAILIVRFHDIKTLAPRGVNNC
ncbi:MAG: hypothetical protein IM585_19335 [Pseudanabaena sp. M135S2SP2A07QC]|nr:hypothetical protein [Pseudanabaena sp. M152S2SP2A07QC]MCA6554075.1 hypothetical protein [Pseudanabaena sp. M135S2SP2A07QC]BCU11909.1 hypothetical protein MAN88_24730 [Microcystis aeruginosa]